MFFDFPCSDYDIKLHLMVRLYSLSLGNVDYFFITFTLKSTLNQSSSIC